MPEPCLVCATPVETVEPGFPKAEALCGLPCIKEWCKRSGTVFLTMEEYAALCKHKRKFSDN